MLLDERTWHDQCKISTEVLLVHGTFRSGGARLRHEVGVVIRQSSWLRPLLVGAMVLGTSCSAAGPPRESPIAGSVQPEASPMVDRELTSAISSMLRGDGERRLQDVPGLPSTARGLAYVALRVGGERRADAWGEGSSPAAAISDALMVARDLLDPSTRRSVDSVEVSVAGPEAGSRSGSVGDNAQRGILGMAIHLDDGRTLRYAPTQMIAANTSFERVVERLFEEGEIGPAAIPADGIRHFEATQLLVDLRRSSITELFRGNQIVPAEAVTSDGVSEMADGMARWLVEQLQDDGRMVYEYFPSRGEESESNNMIRQWMATIALQRLAETTDDPALWERIGTNIEYNLRLSYRQERGLGLIADPDGDVKLGAVALAALALSLHEDRDRFSEEEAALRRTVDDLWQPDGSFETFVLPAGRSDNQNFYPGEALLLWAVTLEHGADPALLERFMRSFAYYRSWHRDHRNPAFVPWHTMAYAKVWAITGDDELRDFIFEMNDWLLGLQQWDDAPAPDMAGRFYDPDRPDFGPPHASSDGVYLEGLIAAYRVAVAAGDPRADAYRTAILRGVRHLMQLQFADDIDMYYIADRERVAGGIRTTEYDNVIRVDNVQHGFLALVDILDSFAPSDYAAAAP